MCQLSKLSSRQLYDGVGGNFYLQPSAARRDGDLLKIFS